MKKYKFVGNPEEYNDEEIEGFKIKRGDILEGDLIPDSWEQDVYKHVLLYPNDWEEVIEKDDNTKALRYNEGKPEWSLVHFKSLEPMVRVLEFGAQKYDRDNWKLDMDLNKILDSTQRHLASMIDGEDTDRESGLEHAGHVMCNMMFYIYHYNKDKCCGNWDSEGKCKCEKDGN